MVYATETVLALHRTRMDERRKDVQRHQATDQGQRSVKLPAPEPARLQPVPAS